MRIFVTGSTSGLGLGAARALAAEGHDVILHRRKKTSPLPDPELWSGVVTGDLGNAADVRSIVEQCAPLSPMDAVIHNAGVIGGSDVVAVNALAPYLLTALML